MDRSFEGTSVHSGIHVDGAKSWLCVSFSEVLVIISSLGYVGVHEDSHHRGRSRAGAIGFSIENGTRSVGFRQKIHVVPARKTWPASNAVHKPPCFE